MNGLVIRNYAAKAAESLDSCANLFERKRMFAIDTRHYRKFAQMLRSAVKISLPTNGHVLRNGGASLAGSEVNLPFSLMAFEYFCDTCHGGIGVDPNGYEVFSVSRRVGLAYYAEGAHIKQINKTAGITVNGLEDDEQMICIMSFFLPDKHGMQWMSSPVGVAFRRESLVEKTAIVGGRKSFYGSFFKLPYFLDYLSFKLQQGGRLSGEEKHRIIERCADETTSEAASLVELLEALSCSNVTLETVGRMKTGNAKRAKKGKLPLYEYKTLMIDPAAGTTRSENQGGTHASPRVHLRRGHIRRLFDENRTVRKKIWINACAVGDKKNGIVHKDYLLRSALPGAPTPGRT